MWRTRAVVSMLVNEIAGVQEHPTTGDDSQSVFEASQAKGLERAQRRAKLMIVLDCLAIVVLFFLRGSTRDFLPFDQSVGTIFSVGVLAVAAHAGFRWAQLENLRTVERLCEDLSQREPS